MAVTANDKISSDHVEYTPVPEHEAQLTGAVALAALFSQCVEAFGLIHPLHKWDKEEQLLLTRLGLQQARLLIWGSVLGVSSPPASVTNRAVPKHPSLAYPDLKEPTFFDPRDPRLDEPQMRTTIEQTLSTIVERSAGTSREEMMAKHGLKLPRRFVPQYAPSLDLTRLEAFREKYELLREVAETFAHLNTRRTNSIVHQPWMIADCKKFAGFIQATQEKVDFLIDLMGVKERVNLSMRMDIRSFGWHFSEDSTVIAQDVSKLRLLQQICTVDYPEYLVAIQQALDNIDREARENTAAAIKRLAVQSATTAGPSTSNAPQPSPQKRPRPKLLKLFKSFGSRPRGGESASKPVSPVEERQRESLHQRSQSDSGPSLTTSGASLGSSDPPALDEALIYKLEKLATKESTYDGQPVVPAVSRHDQYHGLSRQPTKELHQGDY